MLLSIIFTSYLEWMNIQAFQQFTKMDKSFPLKYRNCSIYYSRFKTAILFICRPIPPFYGSSECKATSSLCERDEEWLHPIWEEEIQPEWWLAYARSTHPLEAYSTIRSWLDKYICPSLHIIHHFEPVYSKAGFCKKFY